MSNRILLVGILLALFLGGLAIWEPWGNYDSRASEPDVVFAGKWCCDKCREAPPLKCTGCKVKTGVCGAATSTGTVVIDCPGPTSSQEGTVTCY